MREKMERFMAGRYGVDDLAKFMLGCSVALMVLNLILRIPLLNTLVVIGLVLIYVRMLSRNIGKRYDENVRFLELKNKFLGRFRNLQFNRADRKTHHIYRCPECKQKIRVPKGRGKIAITCPKCKKEFIKKS